MAKAIKATITNKVMDCPTVPFSKLKNFEANQLKAAEKRNVEKLKKVILEEDFCFPLVVWQPPDKLPPYVIDGAGRIQALRQLENEGYTIPDIPVVFVQAESKEQAKRLVTMASSQYGYVTKDSFANFVSDMKGGASALMPSIAISSTAFATDFIGPVVGEDKGNPGKGSKRGNADAKLPEFLPEDILDIGPHQIIVGHSEPKMVEKLVKYIKKEFPGQEIKRNGEKI